MKNDTFGYARVSIEQQNLNRQPDALKKYGVDIIYNEKMTGTKRDRPELSKLLDRMTMGDNRYRGWAQHQGPDRTDGAVPEQRRASGISQRIH